MMKTPLLLYSLTARMLLRAAAEAEGRERSRWSGCRKIRSSRNKPIDWCWNCRRRPPTRHPYISRSRMRICTSRPFSTKSCQPWPTLDARALDTYRAKTNVVPTAARRRILGVMAYLLVQTIGPLFAAKALIGTGANDPSTFRLDEAADLTIACRCSRCRHLKILSLSQSE